MRSAVLPFIALLPAVAFVAGIARDAFAEEASGRSVRPPVDTRLVDHGAPLRQVPQGGQTFAGPNSVAPPPGAPGPRSEPRGSASLEGPASFKGPASYVPPSGPVTTYPLSTSPSLNVVDPSFGLTCTARLSACAFGTGQPLGARCLCPTDDGLGDVGSVTF